MNYGYIRVSRKEQNPARQLTNITKYATENGLTVHGIYQEAFTGTKIERPEWNKLRANLEKGDIIIFDSVSRMSRNADEGFKAYQELYNAGINLVFIKEPHISTETFRSALESRLAADIHSGDDDADTLINTVINALNDYSMALAKRQIKIAFDQAQKEVDDLHQRTSEGMKESGATNTTGADGQIIPGKISKARTGNTYTTQKEKNAVEIIRRLSKSFDGDLDDAAVMKAAQISRNTLYTYKRRMKAQNK